MLGTTVFRLALLYLLLFCLSAMAMLAFLYWNTAGFIQRQTDLTIDAETTGLAEQYRQRGLNGLVRVIVERSASDRHGDSIYLLADSMLRPLAGNLEAWPEEVPDAGGWIDFQMATLRAADDTPHEARARIFKLAEDFHLLVGRDVYEARRLGTLLREAIAWSLVLVIALGLGGGWVLGRNALQRVEEINRTSRDIMAGDLSRRVPVSGSGDELDRLAESLNNMLDQIERLMTGMREVTDNIAHDLRSPISRMRSSLELALIEDESGGATQPGARRETLEKAIADADGLLGTFNALLSIAQAEAGSAREDWEQLDLAELAGDLFELYQPVAEDAGLTLALDAVPVPTVRGNRHLLTQAVANLIDNAMKYGAGGGEIALRVGSDRGHAFVSVADRGPGIAPADRGRVTDRFVRLDGSRSKPGSGLGLSLARAAATLHGGVLRLEDNLPGLAATIELPRGEPSRGDATEVLPSPPSNG